MRRLSLAVVCLCLPALPAAAEVRAVSLDQCADQYLLALAPKAAVGVSHRADDPDSRMRARAAGVPRVRASAEAVLAARPTVVLRTWGGEPRLTWALERRGVRVVTLRSAETLEDVRAQTRAAAVALGQTARGEALVADMDRRLARARGAWGGRPALYLTAGAYTAGPGTLIDAILRWTGLRNLSVAPGFSPTPTEALVLAPPAAVVRGFFDGARWTRWSPGRRPALKRALAGRTAADLPAELIGCPAWYAGEAAERLAARAPRS